MTGILSSFLFTPPRYLINSSDVLLFPYFALGHFSGSLISLGSLAPHWMIDMMNHFNSNDINEARKIYERLYPVVDMFYTTPGFNSTAFIKEALYILGVLAVPSVVRLPHPAFTPDHKASIRRVMDESGLIEFYKKLT